MRPNAIERFEEYHKRMIEQDRPIPHWVARDYLDTLWFARFTRPGLHNVTITVTKKPLKGLLNWDLMLTSGTDIRVAGTKYVAP